MSQEPWWMIDEQPPDILLDDAAMERAINALTRFHESGMINGNPEDLAEIAGTAILAYIGMRERVHLRKDGLQGFPKGK